MGVLNVTPDSFSDGGRFLDVAAATEQGLALAAAGADVVDVGGESTRPGAERVDDEVERDRVVPVITELVRCGVRVSIDTSRAAVAQAALDAGADIVNDVSGGLADPDMVPLVADRGATYVVMHWRGPSATMQDAATYDDVVAEVRSELADRVADAVAAGVDPKDIVLDPGLGFAKQPHHNWQILARFREITSLGLPVLVGASRKSFLGAALADAQGPRPVAERESGTVAVTTLVAESGAWGVRVHDVRASVDALRVVQAVTGARQRHRSEKGLS